MKKVIVIEAIETESGRFVISFGRHSNHERNIHILFDGLIEGLASPDPSNRAVFLELLSLLTSAVESVKIERPDLAAQIRSQVIRSLKNKK
jgi:hypothetical protein